MCGLDEEHNAAQNGLQSSDVSLPHAEVSDRIHGGHGQRQDVEQGSQVLVKFGLGKK